MAHRMFLLLALAILVHKPAAVLCQDGGSVASDPVPEPVGAGSAAAGTQPAAQAERKTYW